MQPSQGMSGIGMNAASLQDMHRLQQQLQAQYRQSQQQQHQAPQPVQLQVSQQNHMSHISPSDYQGMNSQQQQQQQQQQHMLMNQNQQNHIRRSSNPAAALMQQQQNINSGLAQQQPQQQHQASSLMAASSGNASSMFGNWGAGMGGLQVNPGSTMDASSGSSARLMAMAGMGMSNANNNKGVMDTSNVMQQKMQAFIQQQQQHPSQLQNQTPMSNNLTQQQQQLLRNKQLASNTGGAYNSQGNMSMMGQQQSQSQQQQPQQQQQDSSAVMTAAAVTTPNLGNMTQQQQLIIQQQFANLQKQMQQGRASTGQQSGSVTANAAAVAMRSAQQANAVMAANMPGMMHSGNNHAANASGMSGTSVSSQASLMQARQQQLLQQMQQQQQQRSATAPGMMDQMTAQFQQQLQPQFSIPQQHYSNSVGMSSSHDSQSNLAVTQQLSQGTVNNHGGMGSLNEQQLRLHQQNLIRTSTSAQGAGQDAQTAARLMAQQSPQQTSYGMGNVPTQLQFQNSNLLSDNASLSGSQHGHLQRNSTITDISMHSNHQQAALGGSDNGSAGGSCPGPSVVDGNGGVIMASSPSAQSETSKHEQKSFLDGNLVGGWQSNSDLPDRRKIIFQILDMIQKMKPKSTKVSSKLPHMAKSLEEHLYRSARTKAEYLDMTTLKSRLQAIAQGLGLHRHSSSSSMDRSSQEPQQQQQQHQMQQDSSQAQQQVSSSSINHGDMNQQQLNDQSSSAWSSGQISQTLQQNFSHSTAQIQSSQDGLSLSGLVGHTEITQQQMQPGMDDMTGQLSNMPSISSSGQGTNWGSTVQGIANNGLGHSPVPPQNISSNNGASFAQMNHMQQQGDFGSLATQQLQAQQHTHQYSVDSSQHGSTGPTALSNSTVTSVTMGNDDTSQQAGSAWLMQDAATVQKKRVIRQQQERLLLLRHASKCRIGQSCPTKFCAQMVTLWRHMRTCRDKNCRTSHCLSSRCVLNHYRICKSNGQTATCEVCGPVMARIKQLERDDGSTDPLTSNRESESILMHQITASQSQNATVDAAQIQQTQQLKLQQQIEMLQQLQKQQNQLLQQQHRLQEQAHNITDPNSQQALQLQQQQILLNKLQQKCQQKQLDLQNELREQATMAGMNQIQVQMQQQQQQGNATQGMQQQEVSLMQQGSVNLGVQQHGVSSTQQGMTNQLLLPQGIPLMQQNSQGLQNMSSMAQGSHNTISLQQNGQGMQQQGMNSLQGSQTIQNQNDLSMQSQGVQFAHSQNSSTSISQGLQSLSSPGVQSMQSQDAQSLQHQGVQPLPGVHSVHPMSSSETQGFQELQPQEQNLMSQSLQNIQVMQQQQLSQSMQNAQSMQQQSLQGLQAFQNTQAMQQAFQSLQPGSTQGSDDLNQVENVQSIQQEAGLNHTVSANGMFDFPKKRRSRTENKPPRSGKGKRITGGRGKAISNLLAGEQVDVAKSVKAKNSLAKKKVKIEVDDVQSTLQMKDSDDKDKKENLLPPRPEIDTSLLSAMTKDEISKHLESLNKGIRLSSRTVTHKCMPLLQEIIDDKFGWVFIEAVDPVALGLPDYFDVVKYPMHLELVKKKLENAIYSTMDAFARDVKLVFENAILYNGESSEVGSLAQSMLTKFDDLYSTLLQGIESSQQKLESKGEACSLCGTQKRRFEPAVLYCQGRCGMQRIQRQATYYTDRTKQNHWCGSCYNFLQPEEPIVLDDGSEISKKDLQEFKNDALPEEGWVNCDECQSWVHQICALFNGRTNKSNATYTCPKCYLQKADLESSKCQTIMKGAQDLPQSTLSRAIESGLKVALDGAYVSRAAELGVSIDQVEKAEYLNVRVLSNVDKKHFVGDEMFRFYSSSKCTPEFPVRSKCIGLFQKIHGVDTLLFAMYVYEYGHNCPAPNKRRVYISYLDSVQYFEPKVYRTTAYHSILIEYLRYVKKRGFHTAHIWSCPPTPGDDYIFYCHPEHQRIPREDMLRTWYHKMLDKAKTEGVVIRTTTLYNEYFSNDTVDPVPGQRYDATCLPYFEGDYIPGEIENIIRMLKNQSSDTSSGHKDAGEHDEIMTRIGHNLAKMKENFIVVHLRNRRFAAAVERGDDVSNWQEDSDDEVVRSKRAKISGKDSSVTIFDTSGQDEHPDKDENGDCELSIQLENVNNNLPSDELSAKISVDGFDDTDNTVDKSCFDDSGSVGGLEKASAPLSADIQSTATDTSLAGIERSHDVVDLKRGADEMQSVLSRHFSGIKRSGIPVADTCDEDAPFESEMFESRQQFLNYCQTTHCQFDELRRSKHSTMMVLFQLHNPTAPKFLQQCGACYVDITHGIRYHCNMCPDFDLCQDCYEPVTTGQWAKRDPRFAHNSSHTFSSIDMEASSEDESTQEEREKSLKTHIALLEHAGNCEGPPTCALQNCQRMKSFFQHVHSCETKPKKDCRICSRLLSLCAVHARMCAVRGACPIPFCDPIRERHMRLRRQQQLMDDRRRQAQNELYHAGGA